MSAVRERRTAPMNGAARIAFVLCVASALSMAVEAETTTYVGYCDDISFLTGSSSQTVQAFDFLQCCSSSLAKGFSYSVATNVGTTYTAKVVKSSSNSGTMFGGHCEVYNGGASCSGSACYEDMNGYYQCKLEQCCWEASADNWCLNVQCRNNDGSACNFKDFTITFDAHTVLCAAGTDYDSNRGEYLDGATCQSCPANSKGAGGTATTCTCADGYYATKYTTTVDTCTVCPAGSSKTGSTIFGDSAAETTSVCIVNCASGKYWDGDSCEHCPANSVGAGGSATTCTCAANYWAKKSGSIWTCELCSFGRTKDATSTVPGSGDGEIQNDVCNANCAANQYWDGEMCAACPTNSVGDGGTATQCTCAANYWAKWQGASSYNCELCSGGRTKGATSMVPGAAPGEDEDTVCADTTSCTDDHYLSGGECVACPVGSTSTDATSTTCECGASQYFADGSCNACPSTSTCASSSCSALTECKCPADHYVARPSGDWVCTECKSGQSRAATAIPSANNLVEDGNACSAATVCADNDYLAMDIDTGLNYCEECPVGSTSTDATSTTCEDSVGGASAEYGDCECYCDGSYQGDQIYDGKLHVDDGQGGVGITQSFCEDNGPSQCPNEGFTCDGGTVAVNWAYDSTYTGAQFGAPSPGDSGPPPGGSTSDEYGDCECLCGNGNSFNPPVFPNQAGPDPGSVTESECTSQGTVMCKEMWTMMVENYPNVPPCSSGTVDEVYTAWIEDTSP